jgi:nitrogen fixation/metabolism regulation signal transduction histidine kinase
MLKKLGKNITLINTVAFIMVIIVGGGSIFLAQDILHNVKNSKEMSEHIMAVDVIHADSFQFLLAIHHFLIDPDEVYAEKAVRLLKKLDQEVLQYREAEEDDEHKGPDAELELLDKIYKDIQDQKQILELFKEYAHKGTFDKDTFMSLEEFAYAIEDNISLMNRIHFAKIKKWEEESLSKMWRILFLYLVFVALGGIAIYIGHRFLIKRVVNPLIELSNATIEFAGGIYNKRVHTDSKTEIGLLYDSFNKMAEKLQENDEFLRKFNEELEEKVEERTIELQETNKQLRSTRDALVRTERIAAVGQIAAGVTHEIKNPLNSLSINTQMLMKKFAEKDGTDSSTYESASLIKFEINRINNILEEFVKFAKFPEPRFFDNDINQVIREVVDLISETAKEAGVAMKLSLQEDIPGIKFDARQMKEVLMNLSQNALKAMHEGGSLEINTSIRDGQIIINTIDSGEGIQEKNLEKIFTPFYSTRAGGLGLGLPIVQRIIESHGGKISCISEAGKGTTFEIIFPMEREQGTE